ncbi:thermonuclease family protein [Atrimonas thermophila]|uniref:thermonuclease family protein n=1 Tax=Atrimonas thermophila TaxID=3064161 RepID=UPI00399C882C
MKIAFLILVAFWIALFFTITVSAQEELMPVTVLKVSRPHIVLAEVCCNGKMQKVRIKLAGVKPPLGNFTIFEQGKAFLRELVRNQEIYFDFATGHTQEEEIWVGFLYLRYCSEAGEEWILVNGELIKEGFVEVDVETAGENQLPYLLSLEEEAKNSQKGLWKTRKPESRKSKTEECPSCIR